MASTKIEIESLLSPYALKFTPSGTETKAVVHQWIHAINNRSEFFAQNRGADGLYILDVLQKNDFFKEGKLSRDVLSDFCLNHQNEPKFRFVDLFAGIGGMRLGFESAGGACVFSSEFEKNAQTTYEENFGEFPFGDIKQISEEDIPAHDVLVAGFPCQPFSHAGLKLGIGDTRGTLFYNIAQILEKKKPRVALLENVRGLISHDKGYTLRVILKTMTDIGYKCIIDKDVIESSSTNIIQTKAKKMVLKSKDFGVPQNRQRIYIVLWRDDIDVTFKYPLPSGVPTRVGSILESNPDAKYTISDKLWAGHNRRKTENKIKGKGFGYGIVAPDSDYTNTISARYYKDGSEILISQENMNPRKLTPREAARLQGFPDDYIINKSDVQAYKQFGNSVSVPVIKYIAKNIIQLLDGDF